MTRKASDSKLRWQRTRFILCSYGLFAACGAIFALASIWGSRSDPGSGFLLGLSLQRILLGGAVLLAALFFSGLTLKAAIDGSWAERMWEASLGRRSYLLFWGALTCFAAGWIGSFLPEYRAGVQYAEYILRLRPVFIWLTTISAAALLIMLLEWGEGRFKSTLAPNKPMYLAAGVTLAVCLLIWALMTITGLGISLREDYWYGAGVPALGLQIFLALGIGTWVWWAENKRMASGKTLRLPVDLIACLLIWAVTAILWAREPMDETFFMLRPIKPNQQFYPFSDAALFDIGSQYALIGQGMFNGLFFDRALYPAFLTYLHALIGQSYEQMLALQAVIYAVFPVIIYLLGKELHSRAAGAAGAVITALRGVNSIAAATWIDLASPKMMLTDFPTAIGAALFTLLVVKWLKNPQREWREAMWAGAVLGLTVMLRTHVLLLWPSILLFALGIFRWRWKPWILGASLVMLGMATATFPWDLRNHARGAPLFSVYSTRIQSVLRQRYGWPPKDTFVPSSSTEWAGPQGLRARGALSLIGATESSARIEACDTFACHGANHFFHNLATSVLFLPTSPVLDDLRHTVTESLPYWQQNWRGEGFTSLATILLAFDLAVMSLGIGAAWERWRLIGLTPVLVYFTYILSNAVAQTSGGRYIVPVDWVVAFYFVIGALKLIQWAVNLFGSSDYADAQAAEGEAPFTPAPIRRRLWQGLSTLVIILAIGSLVPLSEVPFPRRYQDSQPESTLAMLDGQGWLDRVGLKKEALDDFLSDPKAELFVGRALYPRHYRMTNGEGSDYPYLTLNYPRMTFIAIGPTGEHSVILPGDVPQFFPHPADVVVLSCNEDRYSSALAVFVLSEPGAVYVRSPESTLKCPLQEPACENDVLCISK